MRITLIAKLGAALCALALGPVAGAQAATLGGGLVYDDAAAPTVAPDGSTLVAPLGDVLGAPLEITGTLTATRPGDPVVVQHLDTAAGWLTVATTTVGLDGTYRATWLPERPGRTTVRVLRGDAVTAADASAAARARGLTVYRPAKATWYGPGFFGKRTACGRRLTRTLLGVAHKRLPCGTLVEVFHRGRTITVPVVDRGPFRHGATWDLTAAAAKALGVTTTTTIGTIRAR